MILSGAAPELEIAIPQHREYVRGRRRLHRSGGTYGKLAAWSGATGCQLRRPQGASGEVMASARPRFFVKDLKLPSGARMDHMPDAQNTDRLSPRYIQAAVLVQRAASVIDERSNLVTQLRELEGLREQVRKAELARSPRG
jgi:hypothetical protein